MLRMTNSLTAPKLRSIILLKMKAERTGSAQTAANPTAKVRSISATAVPQDCSPESRVRMISLIMSESGNVTGAPFRSENRVLTIL